MSLPTVKEGYAIIPNTGGQKSTTLAELDARYSGGGATVTTGSWTALTYTGFSVAPDIVFNYLKIDYGSGNALVNLTVNTTYTGTSNGSSFIIAPDEIPAAVIPSTERTIPCSRIRNFDNEYAGQFYIKADGQIQLLMYDSNSSILKGSIITNNFTSSGGKGIYSGFDITYRL